MATERIVSLISRDSRITIRHKIKQYDRYLQNLRYQETYAPYGNFGYFTLLFVTLNQTHVENIRRELTDLPPKLSPQGNRAMSNNPCKSTAYNYYIYCEVFVSD